MSKMSKMSKIYYEFAKQDFRGKELIYWGFH